MPTDEPTPAPAPTDSPTPTPAPTDAPTPTPAPTETPATTAQTTSIILDSGTTLTVKYEASLGDLLVSVLLTVAISMFLLKWGHSLIWGRR
jgi:hypothetical protein